MILARRVLLAVVASACGADTGASDGSSGSTTATTTGSEASTDVGSETTGVDATDATDATDGATEMTAGELDAYAPCPNGDECALCVQTEQGSICGPSCPEYGPGPALGRCPDASFLSQTICPYDHDLDVPALCLITCGDGQACPDPEMICVDCPAPYADACLALWGINDVGPMLCVWPGE